MRSMHWNPRTNILACLGIALFAALCIATFHRSRIATELPPSQRAIEFPESLDLGPLLNGSIHQSAIPLKNTSRQTISLTGFKTDCSCLQVYEQSGGVRRQLDQLTLAPGEAKTIYADVRVSTEPGIARASFVEFKADEHPLAQYYQVPIFHIPVARLYTMPRTASFGVVAAESAAVLRVELRSDGSFHEPIRTIRTSKPELFSANFVEATEAERSLISSTQRGQVLLGYVDLMLKAEVRPDQIGEELSLLSGETELIRLPVSATSVGYFRLSPATVILPRVVGGDKKYSAKVMCSSRDKEAVSLRILQTDPLFKIDVLSESADTGVTVLEIALSQDTPPREDVRTKVILDASGIARRQRLELPITILASPLTDNK